MNHDYIADAIATAIRKLKSGASDGIFAISFT